MPRITFSISQLLWRLVTNTFYLLLTVMLAIQAHAFDVESDSSGNVVYVLLDNENPGAVYHTITISAASSPSFVNGVSASLLPAMVPGQQMRLAAIDFNVDASANVGDSGDLVLQIDAIAAGISVSTDLVVPLSVVASAPTAQGYVGTGLPYADPDGPDTDGDGAKDSAEIAFGSDLNDANSVPGDGNLISSVNVPLLLLPFTLLLGLLVASIGASALRARNALQQIGAAMPAILIMLLGLGALLYALQAQAGTATRIQMTAVLPDLNSVESELTQTQSVNMAASSTGAAGGPELAVDGSMATRWESQHGIDPSWITVDFGTQVDLTSISIFWEAANAENYQVQVSNDNSNWTTQITYVSGLFGDRTDTHALSGNYRYLRIYATSRSVGNMWGYSIWEIDVNGVAPLGSDADNDGISDDQDGCANTPANTIVGSNGCELGTFGGYDAPTSYPGMTLVWSDEFNGNALDANNWTHEFGTGCPNLCGWGNNELQYYLPQNTTVENGLLTIEAKQQSIGTNPYTSSRIKTQGKQSFKYGRIDIRAVMPQGTGLWPALWMLGESISSVGWPASGEIDIMEMRGNVPNKILGTAHWQNSGGGHSYYSSEYGANGQDTSPVLSTGTFADEFHVYSLVWTSGSLEWYLDGSATPFHVMDISQPELSEFQEEFYFLFNIAVGGNFLPNPNGSAVFPQKLIVDYIRVYQ